MVNAKEVIEEGEPQFLNVRVLRSIPFEKRKGFIVPGEHYIKRFSPEEPPLINVKVNINNSVYWYGVRPNFARELAIITGSEESDNWKTALISFELSRNKHGQEYIMPLVIDSI